MVIKLCLKVIDVYRVDAIFNFLFNTHLKSRQINLFLDVTKKVKFVMEYPVYNIVNCHRKILGL